MDYDVQFEIDPYQYDTGKWWGRIVFRYTTRRSGVQVRVEPYGSDFPRRSDGFDTEEELRDVFGARAKQIIDEGFRFPV